MFKVSQITNEEVINAVVFGDYNNICVFDDALGLRCRPLAGFNIVDLSDALDSDVAFVRVEEIE